MDAPHIRTGAYNPSFVPIWAFAAVALVFLFVGNRMFDNLRDGIRRDVQGNISAVGTLKANQLRDWMDDRLADSRTLAEDSFFAHEASIWLREGARAGIRRDKLFERLSAFLDGHHFRTIVLYDPSGRVILKAGKPIDDAEARGTEARRAVTSGQHIFVDLHPHRDPLLPFGLGFMRPLRDGASRVGAIYLVEDPERYLFPLIHLWPGRGERAETQLVRLEGDEVLFLDKLRYRPEPAMGYRLPLSAPRLAAAVALRGKQGLLEGVHDYRGMPVLSYATAIEGTPWMLISKIDEEEAYGVIDQVRRVAGLLALLVFGLTGAWFWQWLRRGQLDVDAAVMKERLRADAMQIEGEKHFRTVFEHTALPMARNALNGEFIEVNDAWCGMFGYSREEALSRRLSWQQITHPEDLDPGSELVKQMLAGEIADFKVEKRYIRKDGKILWGILQVTLERDIHGAPQYFISAIQDITERKQAEQMISFMAYHDKLTGLPNRALLFDRLSQAMSQAKRDGKYVALMFVDLDGFKAINDEHGHEAGDAVLKMAAQRFLACVRAVDTVARLGGDEFAIVLGNLEDPQQAKGVAEKIVHAFAQGLTLPDGGAGYVGASVGISIYPEHGSAMDSLLTAADRAMYGSKRSGKNTYTFFRERGSEREGMPWIRFDDGYLVGVSEIDEQHRNLVYLVNRLNDALKHDESPEAIMQMFDELLVATTHHFETESRYMERHHYPEQAGHEQEHARLVTEALHMKGQFSQGREQLALQSMKDWLLGHIVYSDKKLGAFLSQHNVK